MSKKKRSAYYELYAAKDYIVIGKVFAGKVRLKQEQTVAMTCVIFQSKKELSQALRRCGKWPSKIDHKMRNFTQVTRGSTESCSLDSCRRLGRFSHPILSQALSALHSPLVTTVCRCLLYRPFYETSQTGP